MESNHSIGRLISIIHRSSFSFMNQLGKEFGLTHSQLIILHHILLHREHCQKDFQDHFKMDKGTVSVIIKGLEKGGFIYRQTDPNDKRSSCVFPTEKALSINLEIEKILESWTKLLLTGFSPAERLMAFELLNKMIDNINNPQSGNIKNL